MGTKRIYRLERVSTNEVVWVNAHNRKEAHDMSINLWPGETVEVCTSTEYHDRQVFRQFQNQVFSYLDGIEEVIPDSNYVRALAYIESVKLYLQELEIYFENQQAAVNAGEGKV